MALFVFACCSLRRVRQRQEYQGNRTQPAGSSNGVVLQQDYAIKVEDDLKIGRIQRVILRGLHGQTDYTRPVEYDTENKDKLTVHFQTFKTLEREGNIVCSMEAGLNKAKFTDIITRVKLSVNETGDFQLPSAVWEHLLDSIGKGKNTRGRRRAQKATDDGRARTVLCPWHMTLGCVAQGGQELWSVH